MSEAYRTWIEAFVVTQDDFYAESGYDLEGDYEGDESGKVGLIPDYIEEALSYCSEHGINTQMPDQYFPPDEIEIVFNDSHSAIFGRVNGHITLVVPRPQKAYNPLVLVLKSLLRIPHYFNFPAGSSLTVLFR